MSSPVIEQRLRWFLLSLAAVMCAGTIVELIFAEHTQELTQWLPFGLCGLGLISALSVLVHPRRWTIWTLWGVMSGVGLGSLFGAYEHFASNWEFAVELQPDAAVGELLWETLHGASPMLAPGSLGLAAIVALAATYYHPALGGRSPD